MKKETLIKYIKKIISFLGFYFLLSVLFYLIFNLSKAPFESMGHSFLIMPLICMLGLYIQLYTNRNISICGNKIYNYLKITFIILAAIVVFLDLLNIISSDIALFMYILFLGIGAIFNIRYGFSEKYGWLIVAAVALCILSLIVVTFMI